MKVEDFIFQKDEVTFTKNKVTVSRSVLEQLLKEYAEINCDEQKVICADKLQDPVIKYYHPIINAERPTI